MRQLDPRAVSIRRASAADADIIAPLFDAYRQFYRQASDLARARSFIRERLERGESVVFLAMQPGGMGEVALGFVQLYPSFSSVSTCAIWVLNDLYVVPEARGLHVGRALVEEASAHAKTTRACPIVLSTARDNARASALYKAQGYVRDTEFDTYTLELPQASSITP
jgi:ribosomal protein S18 acetylase RimI-like enzyme